MVNIDRCSILDRRRQTLALLVKNFDQQNLQKYEVAIIFGMTCLMKADPPWREAIRWAYVYRCRPAVDIRELGLSYDGLAKHVRDGHSMVRNLALKTRP